MRSSIRWRIAIPYVVLILLAMLGLAIWTSNQVHKAHLENLEAQLSAEARLMADTTEFPPMREGSSERLDSLAERWAKLLDARVTFIGNDGAVLGDSHADPIQMDNHLGRPEVQQALNAGQGTSIRFSRTVGYEMMYAAVPVSEAGAASGIVRVSLPLEQIEASVGRLRRAILTTAIGTALLAVLLAILVAERIARPVRELTRLARRVAEGDLDTRLFPDSRDEIGELTRAFNDMADQLRDKIRTLSEERRRLDTMLEHMADGIIVTDSAGRVRLINPAAVQILETSEDAAQGRTFAQAVRHHRLVELWRRCRQRGVEQTETVEMEGQELFLQTIVTPLQDGHPQDFLVILQDLTKIRRLETVRRDFISNISHELRTPLAGLKALVDTLRDGALEDPPAARRFLDRIETEVDALTQTVRELLELSRVESGEVPLSLTETEVRDVVAPAVERLRPQAERAGLDLTVSLPADLPPVVADAERVQQVVTNLVHNAIKFTPSGGVIDVSAERGDGEAVVVSVRDTGVGIPADDLPRIFERFYKADRARSGGGTGLGLAIAKHIVQGHGGRIWAESTEGKGSTFFFVLPAANSTA